MAPFSTLKYSHLPQLKGRVIFEIFEKKKHNIEARIQKKSGGGGGYGGGGEVMATGERMKN